MKSEHINMRIEPNEKKIITENAAALGLSVATFLLACAKAYEIGAKAGDKVGERILRLARESDRK